MTTAALQRSSLAFVRAKSLARDVQNVSRQLHPGQLEFLGLVPTLRRLCRDMSKLSRPMVIQIVDEQVPRNLAPDLALCVYRVGFPARRRAGQDPGLTSRYWFPQQRSKVMTWTRLNLFFGINLE